MSQQPCSKCNRTGPPTLCVDCKDDTEMCIDCSEACTTCGDVFCKFCSDFYPCATCEKYTFCDACAVGCLQCLEVVCDDCHAYDVNGDVICGTCFNDNHKIRELSIRRRRRRRRK